MPPRKPSVATEHGPGSAVRPEEVLTLLARAVRQFHTYPPASAICSEAVAACRDGLVALDDRDQIAARVAPAALLVDDAALGGGTIVEQELARRLHRAGVAALVIDRAASPRDLTRFCCDLLACADPATRPAEGAPARADGGPRLQDLLEEHGVDKITVQMAHRPEVLEVGAPSDAAMHLVSHERLRREALASTGPVSHLYPPDKGWVRVDPAADLATVSLADLALLVDDPGALATMLMRLTDEELPDSGGRELALAQKFSDIATVFASLDPRLARVMFSKLSRAVLDLDETSRRGLLRRTILPALLDGKIDGTVLRDFPDVDLADALCLLLDLETAAPEVLTTALDRLDLDADRRAAVGPLLQSRLQHRHLDGGTAGRGADEYARRLVTVSHPSAKNFAEFAAFDLAVDDAAVQAVGAVVEGIQATDVQAAQLRCLRNLVRIEPNPSLVERFLARSTTLLAAFEQAGRWTEIAEWADAHGRIADALRDQRPDVAEAMDAALAAFCTPARVARIVELARTDAGTRTAAIIVHGFGVAMVPGLAAVLERAAPADWRAAVHILCADAGRFAPALNGRLDGAPVQTATAIIRVLGHAGAAFTRRLGDQLTRPQEPVVREALRALARIGTGAAAALVAARVREAEGWLAAAAEETLWHFPPAEVRRQVRELLARREFVLDRPATAGRLIDRVAQSGAAGLEAALADVAALRFRVWSPAVVRVAKKAQALAGTAS